MPRTPLLRALRCCPQPTPARFLARQPGSWVVLRPDDDSARRYRPALWQSLQPEEFDRLQGEGWGSHFSAQAFGPAFSPRNVLCLRTLVVDAVLASEADALSACAIDRRKERHLRRLAAFPLRPQWLIETRLGVQALFRVLPGGGRAEERRFFEVQARLCAWLGGEAPSGVLQVVRLPGTLQFGRSGPPFACRLLEDLAASQKPYLLADVAAALDAVSPRRGSVPPTPRADP